MTVDAHYFSPTTPGAASFDVDVSDFIRRGRIGPLSKEAQLGAVGSGVVVLDDLDGTLGQASDGILGLKQFYMNETECPAGDRRFFTGYTFDRRYYRGDSLVHGPARKVDVTLMDANAFLSFRVFAPIEIDPTSSFVRPLEDSIDRIQALLAVDFLSTTLFDLGYIPTTGGVEMSANDYTGQKPADVINDIAQVSGWNAWVGYDETENKLFLWFDDWETDGSSTIPYDSTIKLTNVESEVNGTDTFLFEMNAVETVSPGRVVSAAYGTGTGVTGYRILAQTANTFGWRDMVAPSVFVKEQDKLDALLDRYLLDNSTEEVRISLTVQIPVDKVTAIKEGQRIQVHGTHMKSVADDFTWTRILHESIRRDIATMEFYWLDLEVSPMTPVPQEQYFTNADGQQVAWGDWPLGVPTPGNLLIGFLANRATPGAVDSNTLPSSFLDNTDILLTEIPGTDWTNIDGFDVSPAGGGIAMAWRDATADDTQFLRWTEAQTFGRPRIHHMEIAGLSGAPLVVETCSFASIPGTLYASEPITVPSAGYIIAGFNYATSGPHDRFGWGGFTMAAIAPTVMLTSGWMHEDFGGFSALLYRYVSGAGTYELSLERTGAAFDALDEFGWILGFWAGPEAPAFPG